MYPWFNKTFEKLQQRIVEQQLHHGLLFVADHGIGENEFINQLTKSLVCSTLNACGHCKGCLLFDAKSHPDIKRVESDKPSIGVDLIRSASEFVTTTSQLLGNKVVVIENIERMTEAASNSLLKTLEEPSQNTYLLLTTHKPNQILPTITSRCEKIRLLQPNEDLSLSWLASQTDFSFSSVGLKAFSGSPINYLQSLNNETNSYLEFIEDLEQLIIGKTTALTLADKWKNEAVTVLSWSYLRTVTRYQQVLEKSTDGLNECTIQLSQIEHLVRLCQKANIRIARAGINKSLILQDIFNEYQLSY